MAGTHFTVHVDDAEVQARLEALAQANTSDLMPRLGKYLQDSTQDRFRTQRKPDGEKWEKLNPRYAQRKKYNKNKVLTLNGYLRSGIRHQPVDANTVEVGTNTKYAAIHQFGGTITQNPQSRTVRYRSVAGRVLFAGKNDTGATERRVTRSAYQINMPARPFLGISAIDETEIKDTVQDWISGQATP
jgi:phage virion morphogenesis protein